MCFFLFLGLARNNLLDGFIYGPSPVCFFSFFFFFHRRSVPREREELITRGIRLSPHNRHIYQSAAAVSYSLMESYFGSVLGLLSALLCYIKKGTIFKVLFYIFWSISVIRKYIWHHSDWIGFSIYFFFLCVAYSPPPPFNIIPATTTSSSL